MKYVKCHHAINVVKDMEQNSPRDFDRIVFMKSIHQSEPLIDFNDNEIGWFNQDLNKEQRSVRIFQKLKIKITVKNFVFCRIAESSRICRRLDYNALKSVM